MYMKDEHTFPGIESPAMPYFATIFDELAEIGELTPLLEEYMNQRFGWDEKFQREMIDSLYQHSTDVIPQVERYLLEKMCESLSFFLEYTKLCTKPIQNP